MCFIVCVCARVCVRACSQREGDRQTDRGAVKLISERERDRDRETERERERRVGHTRAKRGGGVGCSGRWGVGWKRPGRTCG